MARTRMGILLGVAATGCAPVDLTDKLTHLETCGDLGVGVWDDSGRHLLDLGVTGVIQRAWDEGGRTSMVLDLAEDDLRASLVTGSKVQLLTCDDVSNNGAHVRQSWGALAGELTLEAEIVDVGDEPTESWETQRLSADIRMRVDHAEFGDDAGVRFYVRELEAAFYTTNEQVP